MLNPTSPIPLYRQLADLLAAKISQGQYGPGSRIPSEPQLAASFRIGRPTVRQAIDELARKGMLVRRRGSGTFVGQPRQEVDLFSLDGTIASFQKQGVAVNTQILTAIRQQLVDASEDNPFHQATAFFFSRLTQVDHVPVLVEDLYLHPGLFAGIDRFDLQGRSLSAIVEQHFYLRPTNGKQNFRIGYARDEKARQLQVSPETPVLVVQRYLHFPQIENGVFAELWCRTDQFVFSQHIGGTRNA